MATTHWQRQKVVDSVIQLVVGISLSLVVIEVGHRFANLPNVADTVSAVFQGLRGGWLLLDIEVTSARWILGFIAGTTVGAFLGLMTGRSRVASWALEGFFILCRAIPYVALVPIVIRVWGFSEFGRIGLVAWAAGGLTWVIVHQSARAVPNQILWRCQSLGIRRLRFFWLVLIPTCFPAMVNAARAALALSLLVTAVSEITGVYERSSGRFWTEGLGYRLFRSLDEGRDDRLYAAIVVFALLGTIADKLLLGVHYLGVNFRTAYLRAVARRRARVSLEPFHMASHPAMLEVLGLTVGYSDRIVFEGMSMSIQAGETVAWIAPSGGGKSTGLVALAGLHSDDLWVRGQVLVDSQKPYSNWYGLVLQDAPVFEHLTVLDHVMIGDRISRLEMPTRINTSLSILEQFGLAKSVTQLARELSGGQRQRLALATSIANNPSVLLADEPWSAVDAFTRESLYDFLSRKIIGRTTMLLVTHDVQEAARLATRVYVGVGEDRAEIVFDEFTSDPSSAEWDAELHRRVTLLRNALRNTFA